MPEPPSTEFNEVSASLGHDFEGELNMKLRADTALQEVVGGRIYPLTLPQKAALPALVYAIESRRRDQTLSGPTEMKHATCHIDVRAKRYSEVQAGVKALSDLLDGFAGTLARSVVVIRTILDDEADTYEWPADDSARGTQHKTLTFRFKYREPVPASAQ